MPVIPGNTLMTDSDFAQSAKSKNKKRKYDSSEVIRREKHSPNDSSKEGDDDQGLLPVSMSSMYSIDRFGRLTSCSVRHSVRL